MRYRAAIFALVMVAAIAAALMASAPTMPSFAETRARWRPSDAQLLDRHGDPIYEMRVDPHGRRLAWTPLDQISPALRTAVIASEDRRFFAHHGVDLVSIAGAAARRLGGRHPHGASTITMQLAALLDPSLARGGHRRSIVKKLAQIRAALTLARGWSKPEILEAYLNLVTWRGELQGIGAASRVMLGKAPHGIGAGEAAVLAALVRAPNASRTAVERRALAVRVTMTPCAPSHDEVVSAAAAAFSNRGAASARVTFAPHVAERLLGNGQSSERCTLDGELQRFAAETLKRHLADVRDRHVDDGAVLVVENSSGEVWAYVGSGGESSAAPWVDGVRAARQPGSALKPFLYALALQRHLLTAASILEDTPLELPEERGLYRPLDYDRQFRGLVSMRTALGSSLNVPAVRTVGVVGVEAFAEHLRQLGLSEVVEPGDYYGAALALGSADVSLWDLAGAYRTLANGGIRAPLRLTRSPAVTGTPRRIYSPATAFVISDILADRASRSATFGLENALATRYWSAVKTGTSKDMRDNWCLGYTDRFTVGVWVGNVSGAPMRDVTGITGAAPVWLELMNYLHERYGSGVIARPAGVNSQPVAFVRSAEAARIELFLAGTEPGSIVARLDDSAARIVAPADGTTIAIDPDIPRDQQRVIFEATAQLDLRWLLDGREQCSAASTCWWPPRPGVHTLALVDASGLTLDHISFKVRGDEPRTDEPLGADGQDQPEARVGPD